MHHRFAYASWLGLTDLTSILGGGLSHAPTYKNNIIAILNTRLTIKPVERFITAHEKALYKTMNTKNTLVRQDIGAILIGLRAREDFMHPAAKYM